jgi:hypothetical protein
MSCFEVHKEDGYLFHKQVRIYHGVHSQKTVILKNILVFNNKLLQILAVIGRNAETNTI